MLCWVLYTDTLTVKKQLLPPGSFPLIYLCRVRSELLRAVHCQDHPGEGCTRQDLLDSSGPADEQGKAASVVQVEIGVDCSWVRQFSLCSQKCSGLSGSHLSWAAGKGLI